MADGQPSTVVGPRSPVDEAQYLDGRDPRLAQFWLRPGDPEILAGLRRSLPAMRDDFVAVPLPRVTSADPTGAAPAALVARAQQAKVVDPRLVRRVTVGVKAASLGSLARALEEQTHVRLGAHRSVADEKVTLFVRDVPLRDVMRATARLFGALWVRSGEEGDYRYELTQDLRARLDEEELRRRELNAALLAVDQELEAYRPYLSLTPAEAARRTERAKGAEQVRLGRLSGMAWGPIHLYLSLTAAERASLVDGRRLAASSDPESVRPRLPTVQALPNEQVAPILQSLRELGGVGTRDGQPHFGDSDGVPLDQYPGLDVAVALRLEGAEAGEAALQATVAYLDPPQEGRERARSGSWNELRITTRRSPAAERPDNAAANAALRGRPPFQREVTLQPLPSCPKWARAGAAPFATALSEPRPGDLELPETEAVPHLSTADVWEAVHRATGLPVIADAYTRLYPARELALGRLPLFDALCRAGDRLGCRWKQDGDFLMARSTTYLWDKLKEVPNRLLDRWQEDRRTARSLPLDDLLEMAGLPDGVLDSATAAQGILHCRDLREWGILAGPQPAYRSVRPLARFLSELNLDQRGQVFRASGPGLEFGGLSPAQQRSLDEKLLSLLPPDERERGAAQLPRLLAGARLRAEYVPSGRWVWTPRVPPALWERVRDLPVLSAATAEEALAGAHRIDPGAVPEDVRRTDGMLVVSLVFANGQVQSFGKPAKSLRGE